MQQMMAASQPVKLSNPHLPDLREDEYYHLGLSSKGNDLKKMFGRIKIVCMGGSQERMKKLAEELAEKLGISPPVGQGLVNLIPKTDRYVMYKVGPIVCINHGMGMPSISILLHEMAKLLNLAGSTDVTFFRVGTSGGVDVEPGTICVTEKCYNTKFEQLLKQVIVGRPVKRVAMLDEGLVRELLEIAKDLGIDGVISGGTLCTDDFYEEQGRTDGAICEHEPEDKEKFLRKAGDMGIKNIEMESLAFAAITHKLGIRAACMAVAIVNRSVSDQVKAQKEDISHWETQMSEILAEFARRHCFRNA